MKKKYIVTQSKITNRLVRSINNLLIESGAPSLIPIKDNEDALLSVEKDSTILVPVFFQRNPSGDYFIENNFIKENIINSKSKPNIQFKYIVFCPKKTISFSSIKSFVTDNSPTIDNGILEDLFNSSISQDSMLENISDVIINERMANIFFELFFSLTDSGSESPNYNYLVLQKLDKFDQQLASIINIPFYLRSNSIAFRVLQPCIGVLRKMIAGVRNVRAKISSKAKNYTKRKVSRSYDNESLESAISIASKKIQKSSIRVTSSKNPLVSIIIPVYGKLDFLAKCLYSIQEAKTNIKYEVIIVDDCGPQKVSKFFDEKINNVTIHTNKKNTGFTNTCNKGAEISRGEYLCFLNSDTIVTDFWIDNAVNGFKLAKNIGIVGSKLLYDDGSLQEAGGIVFSNGDAANIGKNENADSSWFKYFKDVDYVSGAALTIKKSDFEKLEGFDKRFTPAYYEDTSLCLDIRHKLKKRVVVNPLSVVLHHEGATNGTDENSGFKKFMSINKDKFIEKHKEELKNYGESYKNLWWDRDKYIKGNVLIIDQCIPTPKEDSGSKDMDNILRALLNQNYRPHLFALSNRGETPETYGYYEKGVHCVFGQENTNFKEFFKKYHSLFSLVIISRVNSYEEVSDIIKDISPEIKTIFYTVDLHHLRLESEYLETKSDDIYSIARDTKISELQAISESDRTVVLSKKEKDYLENIHGIPSKKILIWPLIRSEFEKLNSFKKVENPKDIIFIGGYRHTPNIEAVKLIKEYILPEVLKLFEKNGVSFPGIKLYGSSPSNYIENLNSKNLSYEGYIENESDAFAKARISIAPLPFGAGLKGKTLSSLIYRTPIIGSSFALEGFEIDDNQLMVESSLDAAEFADAIYRTYISYENIEARDWDALIKKLEKKFSYSSFLKMMKDDLNSI